MSRTAIDRLEYRPAGPYRLDIEIFTMSSLRQRCGKQKIRTLHRYAFHTLVFVTEGTCTQWVDFEPVACESGTLLVIRAGQAHSFGKETAWDGWIVLFRDTFLPSGQSCAQHIDMDRHFESLSNHLSPSPAEQRILGRTIAQMERDTLIEDAPCHDVHALLRHQLYVLLLRLGMGNRQNAHGATSSGASERFKNFKRLVEAHHAQWHRVAEYADYLGCTERSLTRATDKAVGVSAKAFITSRIHLEAKRLLLHTDLPVSAVAERLGFEENSNFSKFFRREAGCTPTEFRREQTSPDALPSR